MQVLSERSFLEQLRQREELHESKERVGYRESFFKEVSLEETDFLLVLFSKGET
jgi:hypothetical protein